MDMRLGAPLLAVLVLITGCEIEVDGRTGSQSDDGRMAFKPLPQLHDLETRTFQLEHLTSRAAIALIDPYVYRDRPGAPGTISNPTGIRTISVRGTPSTISNPNGIRAISVRETPDNLDKIARMLEQFDVPAAVPSYRLHFQVVAANGGGSDPRLAPVEEALRKVFRFDGYSLVGEGYVTVSSGNFDLRINAGEQTAHYLIGGRIDGGSLWLEADGPGGSIESTLAFRPGQTLVLGSMPAPDQTVFIVVHVA